MKMKAEKRLGFLLVLIGILPAIAELFTGTFAFGLFCSPPLIVGGVLSWNHRFPRWKPCGERAVTRGDTTILPIPKPIDWLAPLFIAWMAGGMAAAMTQTQPAVNQILTTLGAQTACVLVFLMRHAVGKSIGRGQLRLDAAENTVHQKGWILCKRLGPAPIRTLNIEKVPYESNRWLMISDKESTKLDPDRVVVACGPPAFIKDLANYLADFFDANIRGVSRREAMREIASENDLDVSIADGEDDSDPAESV